MNEEKTKKKTTSKKKDSDKITLSKNELSEVITNALLEYDKKKKEQEENKEVEKNKPKAGFWKTIKAIINPKKHVESEGSNIVVVKGLIKVFYQIIQFVLLIVAGCSLAIIPLQYCISSITPVIWYNNIWYLLLSLLCFFYSRFFVILQMEIEKTKDHNLLFGLFSSIIAIVSIIIAIVK